eukprot:sb/3474195/
MTTEKTPQSPLLEKKEPKLMDDGYQSINRSNDHVGDTSFTQSRRSLIISRCMALACVGFAVIDWVVLAEMLQKLQQPDASGKKYDKVSLRHIYYLKHKPIHYIFISGAVQLHVFSTIICLARYRFKVRVDRIRIGQVFCR